MVETSKIVGFVATGIVSIIVGYLLQLMLARPKLLYFIPPQFRFVLPPAQGTQAGPYPVNTAGLTIKNVGRKSAQKVEIHLACEPHKYQFSSSINFTTGTTTAGAFVIHFPNLGAKEEVTLQVLFFDHTPAVLQIRSDDGPGKEVPVWIQRKFPKWVQVTSAALMLIGLGTVAVFIIKAIIAIS